MPKGRDKIILRKKEEMFPKTGASIDSQARTLWFNFGLFCSILEQIELRYNMKGIQASKCSTVGEIYCLA